MEILLVVGAVLVVAVFLVLVVRAYSSPESGPKRRSRGGGSGNSWSGGNYNDGGSDSGSGGSDSGGGDSGGGGGGGGGD